MANPLLSFQPAYSLTVEFSALSFLATSFWASSKLTRLVQCAAMIRNE